MNNIATFLRESKVARFLIPLGIILIIFSVFLFINKDQTKNYVKTEAVVSKAELVEEAHTDADGTYVDATYKVYVKYTVDGKEYDEELGELSGYKKGDKIMISYNPEDPSQISQPVSMIFSIALLCGGIAALVGGVFSIFRAVKKHKELKAQEEGWKDGK